jgi:hypothetical protein
MRSTTVREKHLIESDDNPANPRIYLFVSVKYQILDDGFVTVEFLDGTFDYKCDNTLPI